MQFIKFKKCFNNNIKQLFKVLNINVIDNITQMFK